MRKLVVLGALVLAALATAPTVQAAVDGLASPAENGPRCNPSHCKDPTCEILHRIQDCVNDLIDFQRPPFLG